MRCGRRGALSRNELVSPSASGRGRRPVSSSTEPAVRESRSVPRSWTFITNHAQVLLCLVRDPHARVSELAAAAQITERAAYRILSDLQEAGYVSRVRQGRRTRYALNRELTLADPVVGDQPVERLFALVGSDSELPAHTYGQPPFGAVEPLS
jgi:DNA-binding transcriptional ArsR family regulator